MTIPVITQNVALDARGFALFVFNSAVETDRNRADLPNHPEGK
jgi:hypothetical protein